jgi:hypothetical protein
VDERLRDTNLTVTARHRLSVSYMLYTVDKNDPGPCCLYEGLAGESPVHAFSCECMQVNALNQYLSFH